METVINKFGFEEQKWWEISNTEVKMGLKEFSFFYYFKKEISIHLNEDENDPL